MKPITKLVILSFFVLLVGCSGKEAVEDKVVEKAPAPQASEESAKPQLVPDLGNQPPPEFCVTPNNPPGCI